MKGRTAGTAGLLLAAALIPCAWAQSAKTIPQLEKLVPKAKESVAVTLDKQTLGLTLKILGNDPDAAKVKEIAAGLDSIYVRSLEFARPGEYTASDVDAIRQGLIGAGEGWTRMVEVRGGDENVDVYLRQDAEKILGLFILAAEPQELTVVHISGSIRPEQLKQLEGFAGIPRIPALNVAPTPKPTNKKEQ
jgi:hypothetical protein